MYCYKAFTNKDAIISPLVFNKEQNLSSGDVVIYEGNEDSKEYQIALHKYNTFYEASHSSFYYPLESYSPSYITAIEIPRSKVGEKIWPKTLKVNTLEDDGEGNIMDGTNFKGIVIYELGLILIFGEVTSPTIQFRSTITILEHQYKCIINPSEFKISQNPTSVSNDNQIKDIFNDKDFSPYITSVGLYNDNRELLAIAKLSHPIPTSKYLDTTIIIKIDD